MTTILHVSDTHLGNRQYGSDVRRDDFADAFDAVVECAIETEADVVIHTGDLFDSPRPDVPTVNRCLDALSVLTGAGIPFYAIVGNHERKLSEQWLDLIERFDLVKRLDTAPTYLSDDVEVTEDLALYGIDAIRAPSWDDFDFALEPAREGVPTLLCMHELFTPLVPSHRGDPYELDAVLDRLNFAPDAIALGDYHGQVTETVRGVKAFYPGSTERCSIEETRERAVLLLDVTDGEITVERRPLDTPIGTAPREFVPVTVEFGEDDGIGYVAQRIEEALDADTTLADTVAVVSLHGKTVPVTARDVREFLDTRGVAVAHVIDRRNPAIDLDTTTDEESVADVTTLLDETVAELDMSDTGNRIEELVRDESVADAAVRDRVAGVVTEERKRRFEEPDSGGDA